MSVGFRPLLNEISLGFPIPEVLRRSAARIELPEYTRVVDAILEAMDRGASISDAIHKQYNVIVDDVAPPTAS